MSFTGIKSLERLSVGKKLGLLAEAFFNTIVVNSLQFLSSIFLVLLVCRSSQPIRTPMNACAIYLPIALPPLRLTELSIENQKKNQLKLVKIFFRMTLTSRAHIGSLILIISEKKDSR